MKHCLPKDKRSDKLYRQLFRIVDGGVSDYINTHPKFFPHRVRGAIRSGVAKRIAGTLKGYLAERRDKVAPEGTGCSVGGCKGESGAV